jgi:glutamate 5-kinase
MTDKRKQHLSGVKRVVVKIGSSLLTDPKRKTIRAPFLRKMAKQIKYLTDNGIETVVVTSGAIAAGAFKLGLSQKPKEVSKLQALAAIGQSRLMGSYEAAFQKVGLKVAQMLLTREDLSDRDRYTNIHNTFRELFDFGIVPIVNENDSVAVEEIRFGDNDTLGALVTHLSEADLLIILTDIDGFFSEDPRLNPKAVLLHEIDHIDTHMEKSARNTNSGVGTGGMQTKVRAARGLMQSGVPMVIARGDRSDVLRQIMEGEKIGTFFIPSVHRMTSRKRWLAWGVRTQGEIIIDEGAKKALLERNGSLLAIGIKGIRGVWEQGGIVLVMDETGKSLAKGISNYSAKELESIKGLRNGEIAEKLGTEQVQEVIHVDNLVAIG